METAEIRGGELRRREMGQSSEMAEGWASGSADRLYPTSGRMSRPSAPRDALDPVTPLRLFAQMPAPTVPALATTVAGLAQWGSCTSSFERELRYLMMMIHEADLRRR
jgi:hypothetical protein